ncbi:hypothetical protein B0E33_18600 [Roseibium algicola]|uniref:Uncharacterized protein n=1 Tax=Roseibium algicola TaxID=2857014 RepID=A0ABN4WY29_9HYPH|nr:hypothetical protein B0E33_18600 [Roseibium aggregatum]
MFFGQLRRSESMRLEDVGVVVWTKKVGLKPEKLSLPVHTSTNGFRLCLFAASQEPTQVWRFRYVRFKKLIAVLA